MWSHTFSPDRTCLNRFQNGEQGTYSEFENDQEIPVSAAGDLFPSPSRTDDSDAAWNERASSRSSSTPSTAPSNTPGINDNSTPLPTMALMGIKQETIFVSEVSYNVIRATHRSQAPARNLYFGS